ncbi:Membrane proteinase PrsW, cleaves anti-sigma factor RsiW, M82 family [Butyrivibrio sp. INlla18]|uniref:PrsW family intramembrane metalloprotease n=1 Tax=Butyrivibrio sp. INlla18 TaxID=1520806 RepID=UPI000882D6D4|nr:PrsW family glutamic-type intramembrane protease [Butyrivibrio sp. INlla18]SDA38479.1 Membrane proteinase PrsW, cleaves anti-sigma factor RsiW, M82 family [Butyrivibrio sp. INlla18]
MSILAFLAVLPAAVLLIVIYKLDNIEKEPVSLMAKVFGFGALSVISAVLMEMAGSAILSLFFRTENALYDVIMYFCVVGFSEEIGKFVALKLGTWKNREFNFSFDGIVYGACATLGFATVENIMYCFQYGLSVAITRAIMSVPGHCIFGVFMGIYYGMAKRCELSGDEEGKKKNFYKSLLIPILLHGTYDFCLSYQYDGIMLVFIVFEIAMVTAAIKRVIKMSKTDSPLAPDMQMAVGAEGMYQQAPMMGQMQTPVMGQPQAPVMNQQPVTPVQQAPMQQTPVVPVQQTPVQQTPVAPVQQAPMQQTPVAPAPAPVQEPVVTQTPEPGIYNPNPVFTPESIENK